jgi:NADH-quinone oxidoreductase subunit E
MAGSAGTRGAEARPAGGLSPEALAEARELVALYPEPRSALVPLCHLAQGEQGWLTPQAMVEVAELTGVTPAEVLGTASFYDMLHTEPVGKYLIGVCTNIACLLNGGIELLEHAEERLGIRAGATTSDNLFTLEEVECIALCDKAPCLTVNWRFFGSLTHDGFDSLVEDLASGRLEGDVPRHGILNRVHREGGLRVSREKVLAERSASDEAVEKREQVRQGQGGEQGGKGSA